MNSHCGDAGALLDGAARVLLRYGVVPCPSGREARICSEGASFDGRTEAKDLALTPRDAAKPSGAAA